MYNHYHHSYSEFVECKLNVLDGAHYYLQHMSFILTKTSLVVVLLVRRQFWKCLFSSSIILSQLGGDWSFPPCCNHLVTVALREASESLHEFTRTNTKYRTTNNTNTAHNTTSESALIPFLVTDNFFHVRVLIRNISLSGSLPILDPLLK